MRFFLVHFGRLRPPGRLPTRPGAWALAVALLGAMGLFAWFRAPEALLRALPFWGRPPAGLTAIEVGFAWPEYRETIRTSDTAALQAVQTALSSVIRRPGTVDSHFAYWRIALVSRSGRKTELALSRDLEIFVPSRQEYWQSPALANALAAQVRQLEERFFGEPLPWSTVAPLFPRGAVASVRDLETGLRFRVYRFGGTYHADVEPVKLEDTEILKSVHGGEWTWKRRAVVVELPGHAVAASMNGMPHGRGRIEENQFRGHFCIHFLGSRVHKTGKVDTGHQLMVRKAAGQLAETLEAASPVELAHWLLAAVNHHDRVATRYAVDAIDEALWEQMNTTIHHLTVESVEEKPSGAGSADADRTTVSVSLTASYVDGTSAPHRLELAMSRRPSGTGWLVAFPSLRPLVDPGTPSPTHAGPAAASSHPARPAAAAAGSLDPAAPSRGEEGGADETLGC